jgi:hypothetical protein
MTWFSITPKCAQLDSPEAAEAAEAAVHEPRGVKNDTAMFTKNKVNMFF